MKIRLYTLPNMITLLNLLSGCIAIVVLLVEQDLQLAFWLICAAALFDFCDGLVARLTHSYSDTGKELDSLADMVSFGVVPATVLFTLYMKSGAEMVYGLPLYLLAAFSALRLAKFNVDTRQTSSFIGLPTPAMALFVCSLGYDLVEKGELLSPIALYIVAVVFGLLMVCNIEMFALKFSNYGWKGNQIRYLFLLASAVTILILGISGIPMIISTYVLVSALFR